MRGKGKKRGGGHCWKGVMEGVLEGVNSSAGRVRWKGPLQGGSSAERGSSTGSKEGF